ncbi:hypothetical protein [Agitococcus lubricus]|uniref:Uncharacterized protein n=1 Tax=Agitococcus lubricus TaxID=1077255 RepID=A0A2T5IZ63_9GAMM|nr:hypothetical protein [Agitococcus lubricus]PTQ89338.1 hypothetical protein C8N29_10771 [Agitococcus lubricus]
MRIWLFTLGLSSSLVYGQDDGLAGIDWSSQYHQQQFSQGDHQSLKIALQPWLMWRDWQLYAELAYEYHHYTSSDIINRNGRLVRLLPRLNKTKIVYSELDSEGMGDIAVGLSYRLIHHEQVNSLWSLDYKHDNGDFAIGLGTGSQDLSLQSVWQYQQQAWRWQAHIGYSTIHSTQAASLNTEASMYFWGVGLQHPLAEYSTIGLFYNDQSAPYRNAPDPSYWRLQLNTQVHEQLQLLIAHSQYQTETPDLPSSEQKIALSWVW